MTAVDLAVVLTGLVLIAGLAWYFFQPRTATDAKVKGGRQVVDVTVTGGYSPSLIRVEAGQPVRLRFHRQENSDCISQVVFSDFARARRWRRSGRRPSTWTSPSRVSTPGRAG